MTYTSIASTLILTLLLIPVPVVPVVANLTLGQASSAGITQTRTGRVVSVGDGDTLRVAAGEELSL